MSNPTLYFFKPQDVDLESLQSWNTRHLVSIPHDEVVVVDVPREILSGDLHQWMEQAMADLVQAEGRVRVAGLSEVSQELVESGVGVFVLTRSPAGEEDEAPGRKMLREGFASLMEGLDEALSSRVLALGAEMAPKFSCCHAHAEALLDTVRELIVQEGVDPESVPGYARTPEGGVIREAHAASVALLMAGHFEASHQAIDFAELVREKGVRNSLQVVMSEAILSRIRGDLPPVQLPDLGNAQTLH